ncbi:MAG: TPM domain-containing protein [Terracidiphilus sp.]|nr:TPM domain-containing protein [Terracidiphilus sp.]
MKFEQVEQLIKVGAPDLTIAEELRSRGVSFRPSESNLEELKRLGAGPRTLGALRGQVDLSGRATPSRIRSLKPQGFVSDYAGVLDVGGRRQLEDYCKALERETGAQLAIVTLSSLEGSPIEQVALDLFRSWGIGRKGFNDGLLLLLAIDDRRSRLEVGHGLTQVVTDAQASGVLTSMRPELRDGRYAEALLRAAAALNLLLRSRQLPAGAVANNDN